MTSTEDSENGLSLAEAYLDRIGLAAKRVQIPLADMPVLSKTAIIVSEASRLARVYPVLSESISAQLFKEAARWAAALRRIRAQCTVDNHYFVQQARRHSVAQPWLVIDLEDGGLSKLCCDAPGFDACLVTCSAATHHGVLRITCGELSRTVLVTGRNANGCWNPDADFGHEGAHSSFGPVPLFSQSLEQVSHGCFSNVLSTSRSDRAAIAVWCYIAAEITVWYIRGEYASTSTGLPRIQTIADMRAWLEIGSELGFDTHGLLRRASAPKRISADEAWSDALAAICWKSQDMTCRLLGDEMPPTTGELWSTTAQRQIHSDASA
jgi:hypothetical protein